MRPEQLPVTTPRGVAREADPPTIYLTVACAPDSEFGRMWTENGDGPDCECGRGCEPTKYVLAPKS